MTNGAPGRLAPRRAGSRLASRGSAEALAGVITLLLVACAPVAALTHQFTLSGYWLIPIVVLSFTGAGLVVARQQPHNRIGWILLGAAGFLILSGLGGQYAVLDYRQHHGGLALGAPALLAEQLWPLAGVCFLLAILLYPDGRPPSRRWKWPMRWLLLLGAVFQLYLLAFTVHILLGRMVRITSNGDLAQTHKGGGAVGFGSFLLLATIAALLVAWVVSQLAAFRRSMAIAARSRNGFSAARRSQSSPWSPRPCWGAGPAPSAVSRSPAWRHCRSASASESSDIGSTRSTD